MTNKENTDRWVGLLLGAIALVVIKSIFENDNSKIISKKGRIILSDSDKMNDINKKIQKSENKNDYSEVYI